MVEAYGSQMRLKECAAITTPDARLIQIQPWDASLIKAIEKAIQAANLGFNPIVDGKVVRIPLPDMSRERRQEFVKTAHRLAEEGRVHVRNVRRDASRPSKRPSCPKTRPSAWRRTSKRQPTSRSRRSTTIWPHKEKELLTV
jgi:ribosome recycling factor